MKRLFKIGCLGMVAILIVGGYLLVNMDTGLLVGLIIFVLVVRLVFRLMLCLINIVIAILFIILIINVFNLTNYDR